MKYPFFFFSGGARGCWAAEALCLHCEFAGLEFHAYEITELLVRCEMGIMILTSNGDIMNWVFTVF